MPTTLSSQQFLCAFLAGALLVQKQKAPNPNPIRAVGDALLNLVGKIPLEKLRSVLADIVDTDKNHRIYVGTVKIGSTTFHCHSAVHELQVWPHPTWVTMCSNV